MSADEDKQEIAAAEAALRATRDRLAKAIEAYEDAHERGVYTQLPELRITIDRAWRAKVDAHLVFIETSLSATIRRLTEYVHYMQEVTAIMSGRENKS